MAQYFLGNVITVISPLISNPISQAFFYSGDFFYQVPGSSAAPSGVLYNNALSFDRALQKSQTSRILTFEAPVKGIYLFSLFLPLRMVKPYLQDAEIRVMCSKIFSGRIRTEKRDANVRALKAMNLIELEANETIMLFYPFFSSISGTPSGFVPLTGLNFFLSLIKETT